MQKSQSIFVVILGGLKVWECSIDLTEYLSSLKIAFRGLKVLEVCLLNSSLNFCTSVSTINRQYCGVPVYPGTQSFNVICFAPCPNVTYHHGIR